MTTTVSFHKLALEPVLNGLKNAQAFLAKGQAHAEAQGHNPDDYLTAKLHPDMADLIFQVQRFSDSAKAIPSRVNPENPVLSLPDVEKTFPEIQDRIKQTIEYLESIDEKSFEGREGYEFAIQFKSRGAEAPFHAAQYVMAYAHPNFWFHITTAYNILRMKGVDVGKLDYLNGAGIITIRKIE
ncbi:hypothetical protein GQ44DRAFT_828766 [Phaeosphaeriaceae sp. PMI808]|nr:hypothetical protein GQ44DRAFT_828766 [Phaeosphaeriaceae sp. PMI808]